MIPTSLASIHYWRADPADWPRLLDRIVELRFPAIDTYVPWAIHMPRPDAAEWGETDPRRDLARFLRLCQERNLAVLLRPGPHINAELPDFGYPRWLIDDPAVQARDAAGNPAPPFDISVPPFPSPSYASEQFYRYVAVWLDEVFPRITPFFQPRGGPVAALQVDNELSYFFRPNPFEADYHPDAVALYRRRLGNGAADPPRAFAPDAIPELLEWCRFKEWLLVYAADRLAKMFRERGAADVPLTLNLPAMAPRGVVEPGATPIDIPGLETAVDVVGADLYSPAAAYHNTRKWARYLHATSRFPFVPEFGAGRADDWPPRDPAEVTFNWRAVLMHGVQAINHYMIVERERWIETPVGPTGDLRPHAAAYAAGNAFQRALAGSRKIAPVLQMVVRDYSRLAAVSKRDEPRPDPSNNYYLPDRWVSHGTFGFRRPIPLDDLRWFRAVDAALWARGYTSDVGDDSLPLEKLRRYKAIVCPAFDFLARATQDKLLEYVRYGGYLIYGPDTPRLDENLQPYTALGVALTPFSAEPGDPQFAEKLDTEFEIAGIAPAARREDTALDLAVHEWPDGRRVLFVANASDTARDVAIEGLGAPFDPGTPAPTDGIARLAPWSIGVWEYAAPGKAGP
jgi:beta-galactosidase